MEASAALGLAGAAHRPRRSALGPDLIRALSTTAACIATVVAGGAFLARWLEVTNHVVLIAAAAAPYAVPLSASAAVLLAVSRRWVFAAAATLVAVAAAAVQAPVFVRSGDTAAGNTIRVLTANLYEGRADAGRLLAAAREHADVLAVQELTPDIVQRLTAAGVAIDFPFRWIADGPAAEGVGLWSRFPLSATGRVAGFMLPLLSARVDVPGIEVDPVVLVVHLSGPWPQPIDDWRSDMAQLPRTLRSMADQAGAGCVIAAGDLNSSVDMRDLRTALAESGYHDAARDAGAGLLRSYPANTVAPPVIGIDHVLTHDCAAISARTVPLPGSDHLGVVATVAIR
ncbi:endonuclease/exonuclease/phosphatase family protein [Mycolicibacterium cosmeticum]|uniref:Metal-dependent hydrolase n=1 Tax=Mycolicibacterium cosmeticum TaxID=258533 RepID=W9BK60_MYCCO|nr:endonuclease/exonuclease/phosphatase family protein [Mycolicibacterium cosmeticum]TLH80260.1 endonuclease/exonuclease/phosphatase family protein [Mycolicibacterium cosmeticum]CDO07440.1 metal-dependent hydrolase [Mycolicibacterium cosmeticum]